MPMRVSSAPKPTLVVIALTLAGAGIAAAAAFGFCRPAPPTYALEIWLTSTADSNIQLYYDYGAGFAEPQSSRRPIFKNETAIPYRLPLPGGVCRALRLDPLECPGTVVVQSARIVDNRGGIVAPLPFTAFTAANEIARIERQPAGVALATTADARDPQVAIQLDSPLDLPTGLAATLSPLRSVWPTILILVGATAAAAGIYWQRGSRASRNTWRVLVWTLPLGVCAVEFVLFDGVRAYRYAHLYPRWNDQIQYLADSYVGYEWSRAHGFFSGLWHTLVSPAAQGVMHGFFGTIAFAVAGASRRAALSLNLLALIAWQLSLYLVALRRTRSPLVGLAVALLPLALAAPWTDSFAGSATDFRLDHLAMCLFGVCASCALLTENFQSLPWSVVFGLSVALMLLTRFLSGTYLVVILLGLLVATGWGPERRPRRRNIVIAALIAFAIAGPIFWLNRHDVLIYYWVGHYVGPESAIRSQHFGLLQSVRYVAGYFARDQLGSFFAGCVLAGTVGLLLVNRGAVIRAVSENRDRLFVGALFSFAPWAILTLHAQKSSIVLGIIAPGVTAVIAVLWLALAERCSLFARRLICGAIVGAVAGYFTSRQLSFPFTDELLVDSAQARAVSDLIGQRARSRGLAPIRVAVDYTTDALDAQVMRLLCYEHRRVWLPFDMTLPTGITAPEEQAVFDRIAQSDFVFVTVDGPAGGWPFDQKLTALRPRVRAWCDAHLHPVEQYEFFGRRLALYERQP